ncbi:hypothetical protein BDV98DRAFT_589190 [Pterulicium gracile]|uniref:Actin cortical patch SUR7/pH-response regulator pali n=1 Tax=Pterulicium gracile TaxID=1884261 RepID=A0A5C3QYI8_9AGAR|nr:hypothetical protein BDV98DRAFT_589190 [Pterula gracilis]
MSVLTTISVPAFSGLDLVRATGQQKRFRFGIWGFCLQSYCEGKGAAYSIEMKLDNANNETDTVNVSGGWTAGLVLPVIVTIAVVVVAALSFTNQLQLLLICCLAVFVAVFVTFVAVCIDAAFLKHMEGKLDGYGMNVSAGPGLWLTVVLLLVLSMYTTLVFLRFRRRYLTSSKEEDEAITWFPMAKLSKLPFLKKKTSQEMYDEFDL